MVRRPGRGTTAFAVLLFWISAPGPLFTVAVLAGSDGAALSAAGYKLSGTAVLPFWVSAPGPRFTVAVLAGSGGAALSAAGFKLSGTAVLLCPRPQLLCSTGATAVGNVCPV
jgi:hypothetical protein